MVKEIDGDEPSINYKTYIIIKSITYVKNSIVNVPLL
jgi:hypothetical protein